MVLRLVRGDILRNVDQHGTRTSRRSDVERLFYGLCQVLHVFDQEVVLDARAGDADRVDFLERIIADQARGYLSAEHDDGNRIHVGRGDPCDGVGHAGARGHEHYPGFAAGPRIAIRRVCRTLFVPCQDMLYGILLVQRIVDVERGSTRIAKHILNALVPQAADKDLCTRQFHGTSSDGSRCRRKWASTRIFGNQDVRNYL